MTEKSKSDSSAKLVVVAAFGDYRVGDVIPKTEHEKIVSGEHSSSVVAVGGQPEAS